MSHAGAVRFHSRGSIEVSIRLGSEDATPSPDDVSDSQQGAEANVSDGVPLVSPGMTESPSYLHLGMRSVLLQVEVRDTGVGIPDEAKGRIFKAFMQADSSTSRRYGEDGIKLTFLWQTYLGQFRLRTLEQVRFGANCCGDGGFVYEGKGLRREGEMTTAILLERASRMCSGF